MSNYQEKKKKTNDVPTQLTEATAELQKMNSFERDCFDIMLREFYLNLRTGKLKLDDQFEDELAHTMNGRSVRYWLLSVRKQVGISKMWTVFNEFYKKNDYALDQKDFLTQLGLLDDELNITI